MSLRLVVVMGPLLQQESIELTRLGSRVQRRRSRLCLILLAFPVPHSQRGILLRAEHEVGQFGRNRGVEQFC